MSRAFLNPEDCVWALYYRHGERHVTKEGVQLETRDRECQSQTPPAVTIVSVYRMGRDHTYGTVKAGKSSRYKALF